MDSTASVAKRAWISSSMWRKGLVLAGVLLGATLAIGQVFGPAPGGSTILSGSGPPVGTCNNTTQYHDTLYNIWYTCNDNAWGSGVTPVTDDGTEFTLGATAQWAFDASSMSFVGTKPAGDIGVSSLWELTFSADTDNTGTSESKLIFKLGTSAAGVYTFVPGAAAPALGDVLVFTDQAVDGFTAQPRSGTGGTWGQLLMADGTGGDTVDTCTEICTLAGFTACQTEYLYTNTAGAIAITEQACSVDAGTKRISCYCTK